MPEFLETTLPNGLRVAAEVDNRGYSAAYGYFVRSGARDEVDAESGLSHFLEHMMFKGTARRSAADVNRELDELGGQGNAYTSEEQTVYYATVLPKFQERIVDLLSDMMRPSLDESEFETERKVILEEIAKYEDQPPFGAFERAMEVHFGPRGLGRRILGTTESIESMKCETMRAYFHRRYRPENMVLAASGNVDFDGLVEQAETLSADWAATPLPPTPDPDTEGTLPVGISIDRTLQTPDAHQAYLIRMGTGPSSADEDRFHARALAAVIGDEGGSRLFWELIDTGKAEVATVWPQEFIDTGAWFTYLVCDPADIAINAKLIDGVLDRVVKDGIQPDELSQAVNKATAGLIMQSERPSNRLFGLGSRWLTHGEYFSTDDMLAKLKSLDADAVSAVATKFLAGDSVEILASQS